MPLGEAAAEIRLLGGRGHRQGADGVGQKIGSDGVTAELGQHVPDTRTGLIPVGEPAALRIAGK